MFDSVRDAFEAIRARLAANRRRTAFGFGALAGLAIGFFVAALVSL